MACLIRDKLYVNEVGTFGMGCASYWWSRLFGLVTRSAISLALRDMVYQFLFADDVNWLASGRAGMEAIVVMLFFMAAVGTPFTWLKVHGGFGYEWIGYAIDLETHSLGISEDRARWLVSWIDKALAAKAVLVRDLVSVIGRLSFTAGPLERLRPFLAPLYAWVSVVPESAFLPPPVLVQLCLRWVSVKLKTGSRLSPCRHVVDSNVELFRTDAKAEDGIIRIGGWETRLTRETRRARWFAVELTDENSPWIGCRGEPFRVIAALEMLATLFGLLAFWPEGPGTDGRVVLGGDGDHR